MGRRQQYGSDAERQRAFRARLEAEWPRVNDGALSRQRGQSDRLQAAVWSAASAGDETAWACSAASVETVLERVIGQFEAQARGGAEPVGAKRSP